MQAKAKILVVDDDLDILTMTKQLLEKTGYEVRTTTNTIGAGYLLGEFAPDLVLLDIMLPGSLSGDQACDTLRQFRSGIKIVFHSGVDEARLAELAAQHNADAAVSKGIRPTVLLGILEDLLG